MSNENDTQAEEKIETAKAEAAGSEETGQEPTTKTAGRDDELGFDLKKPNS